MCAMKKNPNFPILIVDDEAGLRTVISKALLSHGMDNILESSNGLDAWFLIESEKPKIILLDLILPDAKGIDILAGISKKNPDVIVIIVSASSDIEVAIKCMKLGAFDFITKPISIPLLTACLKRAIQMQELKIENELLSREVLSDKLSNPEAFSEIITNNSGMKNLFKYCEAIALSSHPVLITGETGTGKELFSKAIHALSQREGNLVTENVAGVDANVFADTLFGHVKGAYTGADSVRKGLVEEAERGTLLLDEIGDLCMDSQVKLLRLIQEREYSMLGSNAKKISNAKIIASTNQDLLELLNENRFRKDLYYRLLTHHVCIPPLRDRKDDIPLLLDFFLDMAALEFKKKKPAYPQELLFLLKNFNFPGNVRELKSMVLNAVGENKTGVLSLESFTRHINKVSHFKGAQVNGEYTPEYFSGLRNLPFLRDMTEDLINDAMERSGHNQTKAARLIGITQQAISNRARKTEKQAQ
jgi:DNA-binding NtrC family response regulator